MSILDEKFMKGFIGVCAEGYRKGWHERNGGNLSYRMTADETAAAMPYFKADTAWASIGTEVPDLAWEYFLVTGSGKHMRNVPLEPQNNICIIQLDGKGENYRIVWGLEEGGRPTSELPTHLMNHEIKKKLTQGKYRVIYHAHPGNLIALTFVLPLDSKIFTHELWEMATENPLVFPKGLAIVPWMVPGGREIAVATSKLMADFDAAVWAHHGLFCSGADFDETFSLMDTIEKAAEICVKVRSMGGKRQTIPEQGFVDLSKDFGIPIKEEILDL